MAIIGIVAIAKNLAIGRNGKLPWHYSADLKFFKETTMDQAVVMGTKTWRSIGKPLPGRLSIVLSRSKSVEVPEDVMLFESDATARAVASRLGMDLYVIGGAEIFTLFADSIERWIVTEVPVTVDDADTFFPAELLNDFVEDERRELGDGLTVRFLHRK